VEEHQQPPQQPPPLEPTRVELLTRAARAARELCELLWEAMHEELRDPREERVRELSQRLGEVSSTVAMLTRSPRGGGAPGERRTPPEPIPGERLSERPAHLEPVFSEPPPPPGASPQQERTPSEPARMRLVDEHEQWAPVRREEGPSAWVNTVGGLLERHAIDGLPFAVLLVEVVDVAHIERSESPVQVDNLIAQVEGALGRALRAQDTLTRESFGRYWLVAPETNGTGARMLAERLARLVRSSASHRGVPLEVAVGIAVCPEDGTEAPTLAARADLGVFSARATGRTVARTEPPS
jgi:GGDEF domain-containing protein